MSPMRSSPRRPARWYESVAGVQPRLFLIRAAGVTRSNRVPDGYKASGVDIAEADAGLRNIIARVTATWPQTGFGAVQLPIGYFANVVDIGGTGLALCTDGVGSKAIVAQMTGKYDTVGIDCVAMNVNDLLCVGANPVSMVDYIAIDRADAAVLDGIAIGLARARGRPACRSRAARSRNC